MKRRGVAEFWFWTDRRQQLTMCVVCLFHSDMFGDDCVHFKDDKTLSVTVDGVTAAVDPQTRVSPT